MFDVLAHNKQPEIMIFFSIFRDDKGQIMKNKQVGHMLRTKLSNANEGGVTCGHGALDSVYLDDVERCWKNPCGCYNGAR